MSVANSVTVAAWPAARVHRQLTREEPMKPPDVTLAALAVACGLPTGPTGQVRVPSPSRSFASPILRAIFTLVPSSSLPC